MRYILLRFLLSALVLVTLIKGEDKPNLQTAYLIGTITPPVSMDTEITILSDGERQVCSGRPELPGILCSGFVGRGAKSARIEVTTLGYKRYSINVPHLSFDQGIAKINVGEVVMKTSELPTVERVLAAASKEKGHQIFELTLLNKLSRDVHITGLRVQAFGPGSGNSGQCCCPPLAIYDVADKLEVIGGSEGILGAKGEYHERVRGQNYAFTINAQIKVDTCNNAPALEFTLPVSFLIPRNCYSAIQIIMPNKFTIKSSHYQFRVSSTDLNSRPLVGPRTDLLSQFGEFKFILSTGQKDELDIWAVYPN